MRILPSGSNALLVELDGLEEVLGLYAALVEDRPPGVVDLVPAARTVLVTTEPTTTTLAAVAGAVRRIRSRSDRRDVGEVVEIPVTYDGEDLEEVASLLGCDAATVVRRHLEAEWAVAFCGFMPGFGYLTSPPTPREGPRRARRCPRGPWRWPRSSAGSILASRRGAGS